MTELTVAPHILAWCVGIGLLFASVFLKRVSVYLAIILAMGAVLLSPEPMSWMLRAAGGVLALWAAIQIAEGRRNGA